MNNPAPPTKVFREAEIAHMIASQFSFLVYVQWTTSLPPLTMSAQLKLAKAVEKWASTYFNALAYKDSLFLASRSIQPNVIIGRLPVHHP